MNKPTLPNFPLGLETSESSVLSGFTNTGVIEHAPGAVMSIPEGNDTLGVPSQIRYDASTDSYEGYYSEGGWLPFGGGGVRWEMLSFAPSHTLSAGRGYFINNTSAASTAVLPVASKVGDTFSICDAAGKFATYPLTLDPNGGNIYGSSEPMVISTDNMAATFTWTGADTGWVVTAGAGLGQGRVYSREIFTQTVSASTSTITLTYAPEIVDVYVDGKRLSETKYTLNGVDVDFSPAIASGSEVQIIEYTPIQLGNGNSGSSTQVTWVYHDGVALGGETNITIGMAGGDVSEIFINGVRKQENKGYTFDSATNVLTLAAPLVAGDELIVKIGGDPTLYNQIDRTPYEVARVANIPVSQVILSNNGSETLDGKTIIFDTVAQKAWGLPSGIPTGATVVSVSGSNLTYAPGNMVVSLLPAPGFINSLQANDGLKNLGACASITELKGVKPSYDGQLIFVKAYAVNTNIGGGVFQWKASNTKPDDAGCIIQSNTTTTGRWVRMYYQDKTPEMFGAIGDGVADDTVGVQRMFTSANNSTTLAENFFGTFVLRKKYKITSTLDAGRPIKVDAYGAQFVVMANIPCIKFSMHNGLWEGGYFDYTNVANASITENSVAMLIAPETNPIQVMNSVIRGIRVWGAHTGILFNNNNTAIWMVEMSNLEIGVRAGSSTHKACGINLDSTGGTGGNTTVDIRKVSVHPDGSVLGAGLKGWHINGVNEVTFYDVAYDGSLVGSGDIMDITAFRCTVIGMHTEQLTCNIGPFTDSPFLFNCNSLHLDGFEMLLTTSDLGGAWIMPKGNGSFTFGNWHDLPNTGKTAGRVLDLSQWNQGGSAASFINLYGNVKPSQIIGGKTRFNLASGSEPNTYGVDYDVTVGTGGLLMPLDNTLSIINVSVVGERVGSSDMAWGSTVLCLHTPVGWTIKDTTAKSTNFAAAVLSYGLSGDGLTIVISGDSNQYRVQCRVEFVRGKPVDY